MSVLPADSLPARLAERIFTPLAQVRRRCRLYVAVNGATRVMVALIGVGLGQAVLDRALKLTVDQRAVVSGVAALFWLWVLWRYVLRPLLCPLPDRLLASVVDRTRPELHDQMATAVQFAAGQVGDPTANSPQLVRAVLHEACEVAADVPFLAALNHRRAKRRSAELGGMLLLAIVACLALPQPTSIWLRRNWLLHEIPWPQQTYIVPNGFDESGRRRVPLGDELEILAVNRGRVPKSAVLRWKTPSGRRDSEPMTLVGVNRWEVSLGVLTEEVSFRIIGGDERTRQYVVEPIERPRVVETAARITPPAYTGLEPVVLEQQTVFEVLRGATLEIRARLNKPVAAARFVSGAGDAAPCERLASDRLQVIWAAPASGTYSFELVDRDGWTNRRPVRYTVKVLPDLPPDVHVALIGVGGSITPSATLPIELSLRDDYGLGGVALHAQRDDDPPFVIEPEGFESGRREFAAETRFAVGSANVVPGSRLRLWAEAHDQDPQGPNVGRTEPVALRVVSPTDLLTELAGRELELRREFERLISAQRGLKDGLERLLPELPEGAEPSTALTQRLAGLSRRQEAHARNCATIGARFEQILAEMRVNKLARVDDDRRIGQRIAAPLKELSVETMPAASARVDDLRLLATADLADRALAQQTEVLRQMQAVLANMLEWEGYREAVALLQEIIADQTDVHSATIEALERQLEEILELEEPLEAAPVERPGP